MNRTNIETLWVKALEGVLESGTTVVLHEELIEENRPKPLKPYVSIKIISGPTPIGSDENLRSVEGAYVLCSPRQYTLSLQGFGVGSFDSLLLFQTMLYTNGILVNQKMTLGEFLRDNNISIVNRGSVSDITAPLNTGFEKRVNLDIIFNMANNQKINLESIESVKVNGNIIDEMQINKTIEEL